jgi:hypothetical protein
MKKREPSDLVRREEFAQRDGLFSPRQPAGIQSVSSARTSYDLALEGDYSLLDQRLQAGVASREEQKLAADLLMSRIKPRKRRMDEMLAEDQPQLVVDFIRNREHENPGQNREWYVQDAAHHFKISRSKVQAILQECRSK